MRRVAKSVAPRAFTRSVVTLGVPAKPEEIAAAVKIPTNHANELLSHVDASWTAVNNVNRRRLLPLVKTYNGEALVAIKQKVAANPPAAPKGSLKVFQTKSAKDVATLVTFYEETMLPIRQQQDLCDLTQLEIFGLQDNLKLGLAAFKPEQLEQKQKRLAVANKELEEQKKVFHALVADSFNTAIFNDLLNTLRIAAETHHEAQVMAERVLEDMALCQMDWDEVSKMLLKNITFGDGPYEDSGLLFAYCEYPERGEISLSKADLEVVSEEAMRTISKRHQTPITEGVCLRSTEAHPNLQRSVE